MAEGLDGSSSSGRKLTWEDWVATPDDRNRYEILDGKLAVTPPPFIRHQRVSARLQALLRGHVENGGLGEVFYAPVGVVLDEHAMVEPDLVFASSSRAAIIQERAMVGAPSSSSTILVEYQREHQRGRLDAVAPFRKSEQGTAPASSIGRSRGKPLPLEIGGSLFR